METPLASTAALLRIIAPGVLAASVWSTVLMNEP
jgi:hypothetical protein